VTSSDTRGSDLAGVSNNSGGSEEVGGFQEDP